MGCVKSTSSKAKKEGTRTRATRPQTTTSANEVTIARPERWAHRDGPLQENTLQEMRDNFWQHAVERHGGRPEIWEALREATRDLRNAPKVLKDNNIRLERPDMSVCYDDSGTRYELPVYVLSEPANMAYRVLRA